MPIAINKNLIGKEYPPYPVTIERGKIKEFARAIGDLNPFYLDDRVGAASEWGDLIAPPTFAVTFRDETADTGAMLRDLGTDISRILHGEQEFEFLKPIYAGDVLMAVTKVADVYEKTGSRGGKMTFVVMDTEFTNQKGEKVAVSRGVTVETGQVVAR